MSAACCGDRCGFKNLLADGAFLMLSAVGGFGSCRVNDPLAGAVSRNIGLIAARALMPVVGAVILPLGAVAVDMARRRILIGGLELHIISGHGEGGSRLGGVCQSDIALQHDPLVKDLACLRCVRRNGHNGVLRDLVRDWCSCGNGGRALDDRDRVLGRGWASDEPCLAAVGALAGVENPFALALFCGFAAVPVVAELINDMTVAENLSAAGCALLVAAITCGGASGLNHIDQLGVAGNFVEGRGRNALLRDPVARCAVLVAGIALLGTGRRSYITQFKGTAMPEVAGLALYGAAASRAAVVALIGAVSAVARIDVIAFAAMARVCGGRVGRAVVVQRLQWTGMTGVCRGIDIRTGTDDIAAVCAGGVAGVALAVADLCLRIKHRGAAAVVTACIDRLEEELAAAGCTHGAERRDRAAPLKGGSVGHQLEQGLRLAVIPLLANTRSIVVFAEILHLPADGFLTVSLLGIKLDLVAGLDNHTGCPAVFHRHNGGVLCPIAVNFRLFVFADAAFSLHAAFGACGVRAQNHIPAAPAMGNHDELLAARYFALFGVCIVGLKDELLHRLGRAADVEGILIDTAEAGAVPVPAVLMDMALHIKGIVADGAVEHIDLAAAYRIKASVKRKFMRDNALLGAGGHIMRFVFACFEQARKLVALAFANAAHDTVMGNPMLIDPSDIVFRRSLTVVGGHRHTRLLVAVGMGGSQLCLRRFHGVRRVTLSADDAEVGVVLLAGLGGNRHLQCGGRHTRVKPILRQLVGRRRGNLIILPIPLIGQLVALQASCHDREGDRVIFIVQQAVFRLFVIIIVDRGLALDALGLAGDNDGAAADVAADLAHALGVIFMVGRIQLFAVAIAAGVPVLRSVSLPGGGGYVGMSGTAVLCFQMILKIRVAEAPVVMIAAHRSHGIEAAVLAALIAAVLAGVAVVEAQAAVLAEVICVVRIHCAHPLGAVGVAFAALLAQLAGFAELVLVLLIRDPAAAALADVLVPLGAFHAGLAVRAAAALGVITAAVDAQTAVLAALLGQQAFLALLAGGVAIDAVYDAGIIVVHALVHRTEAAVAQRAVHRVAVIVCTVVAEAAGVADGYGAAGALMAFAAQLVILADVALAAGGAVLFLHALRALVALIAPIGCIEQTLTTIVAVEFNEAVGVAVNSAEPATVAHILSPVVVVAVFTIFAVVVVFPKGVGGNHHTRYQ